MNGEVRTYPVQRKSEKVSQVMSDLALSVLSLLALIAAHIPVLFRLARVVTRKDLHTCYHSQAAHRAIRFLRSVLKPQTSVTGMTAR